MASRKHAQVLQSWENLKDTATLSPFPVGRNEPPPSRRRLLPVARNRRGSPSFDLHIDPARRHYAQQFAPSEVWGEADYPPEPGIANSKPPRQQGVPTDTLRARSGSREPPLISASLSQQSRLANWYH